MIRRHQELAIAVCSVLHGNVRRIGLRIYHPLFSQHPSLYISPAAARRLAASLLAFAGDRHDHTEHDTAQVPTP